MKYFVVTTRNQKGSTKVIYPDNYQSLLDVTIMQGAFYFTDPSDGLWKRVHAVPDADCEAIRVLAGGTNLVEEITEEDAFALSDTHQGGIRVTDEARIRQIEIKQRGGETLTAEDSKALDPDDKSPGFGRNETLRDIDNKLKVIAEERSIA